MKIPASFAASKIGWSARQSLKSTTLREGFVAPTATRCAENHKPSGSRAMKPRTMNVDAASASELPQILVEMKKSTHLTPLSPAATIFWKISSQRSGTGRRKVWNSPELEVIHCAERGWI